MPITDHFPRPGRSARFALSFRGDSTEAAYRSHISGTKGITARGGFDRARAQWALAHGLEPDDGAYLGELRGGALSLRQLGEGLAVCGQTREMVAVTIARLVARGFVEQVVIGQPRRKPTLESASDELGLAEQELEQVRVRYAPSDEADRRMIADPLRHAVSRVFVARRFLARIPPAG